MIEGGGGQARNTVVEGGEEVEIPVKFGSMGKLYVFYLLWKLSEERGTRDHAELHDSSRQYERAGWMCNRRDISLCFSLSTVPYRYEGRKTTSYYLGGPKRPRRWRRGRSSDTTLHTHSCSPTNTMVEAGLSDGCFGFFKAPKRLTL